MNSLTDLIGLSMFPILKILRKWRLLYERQVIKINISYLEATIKNDTAALSEYYKRQPLNNSELKNL